MQHMGTITNVLEKHMDDEAAMGKVATYLLWCKPSTLKAAVEDAAALPSDRLDELKRYTTLKESE
jgi:hypothetical protein